MRLDRRTAQFGPSIFSEMSRRAAETKAVNLGQGFPDFDGPLCLKEAALEAMQRGINQYAPSMGLPVLREAIAAHAKRFYGQQVDPGADVLVTSGATEALFAAIQAFVSAGDEVVLFAPFYDSYLASVQLAGGVPKVVHLRPPDATHEDWWFADEDLDRAFSTRTALVIINTPNNPTGKVFTRAELLRIGALAERADATVLSDEVYEHLTYGSAVHVRACTVDALQGRCVAISSAGKTFSLTGWKVGWAIGPAALISQIHKVHQWVTFSTATPLQVAMATALGLPDSYFADFKSEYLRRRTTLSATLNAVGLRVLPSQGTYFVLADTTPFRGSDETDVQFCFRLMSEAGVAAIPPSVFYLPQDLDDVPNVLRFAFCKTDSVLQQAAERLTAWAGRRP